MFLFWKSHGIEKRDLLIPASILLGSIIISLSIFFTFSKGTGGALLGSNNDGAEIVKNNEAVVKITARGDAPKIGGGRVEIVEFSDFQCPFCQNFFNGAYKEIKSKYIDTGKVKFTYRHFPLSFHQNAQKAAEASECANRQGKFFPYHDVLFTKGKSDGSGLNVLDLKQYAKDLGLDTTRFNACLDGGEAAEAVKKDFEEGQKVGVSGTPTLFIDGKRVVGALPFSEFQKVIEEALK